MSQIQYVSEVGVELIGALASDDDVAMAAWVSNDADAAERLMDQKRVKGLINFLWRNKHSSPFEHGIFKFKTDVPLTVAREFQRHRTFSFNEVSGRYTEMPPRFWMCPPDRPFIQKGKMGDYYFVEGTPEQYAIYRQSKIRATKTAWDEYQLRLNAGIAKEVSREDLPLSLMTQFYASVDPRNLMAFLTLRNDKHALAEIRQTAEKMEAHLAERMPYTYDAFNTQRELWAEFQQWMKEKEEARKDKGKLLTPDEAREHINSSGNRPIVINVNTDNSKIREVTRAINDVFNKMNGTARGGR